MKTLRKVGSIQRNIMEYPHATFLCDKEMLFSLKPTSVSLQKKKPLNLKVCTALFLIVHAMLHKSCAVMRCLFCSVCIRTHVFSAEWQNNLVVWNKREKTMKWLGSFVRRRFLGPICVFNQLLYAGAFRSVLHLDFFFLVLKNAYPGKNLKKLPVPTSSHFSAVIQLASPSLVIQYYLVDYPHYRLSWFRRHNV